MVADSCSCRLGIRQRNAAPRGVGCAARPARTTSPPIVGPEIRRRRRRAATHPKEGGDRDRGWDAEEPEHHEQIDRRARHATNCKGIPPAGPPVWSLFTHNLGLTYTIGGGRPRSSGAGAKIGLEIRLAQQTARPAVRLELGSHDGLDGTIGFDDGMRSRRARCRDYRFQPCAGLCRSYRNGERMSRNYRVVRRV